jgi:DNA-3-methyladenine glycosylase
VDPTTAITLLSPRIIFTMAPDSQPRPLPRSFYARDTLLVARELIGMHLVRAIDHGLQIGRIVETEAYKGPQDQAAHSAGGRRTPRTEVMFGPAGHAYVYLIYGFWHCLNVITAEEGLPQGVLLRAIEPVNGIDQTTHGPGLLCRALNIDRSFSGMDLLGDTLWLTRPADFRRPRIARSARIGVDYAGRWAARPWRFFDSQSPHVSTVSAAARKRALATTSTRSATPQTRPQQP